MELQDTIKAFLKSVRHNEALQIKKYKLNRKPAGAEQVLAGWHDAIRQFYSQLDGFMFEWRPHKYPGLNHVRGLANVLSAEEVAGIWEGVVYFGPDSKEKMKHFRIIDFFIDECAVGFYDLPEEHGAMYLYFFEADPISLNLNFNGYLQLLMKAQGFFYWQKSLLAINAGKDNQESEDFKTYMPQIFPDFDFADFEALYNSLKLK